MFCNRLWSYWIELVSEFVQIIKNYIKIYGGCFRLWLAKDLIIFVTDPKDIEVM